MTTECINRFVEDMEGTLPPVQKKTSKGFNYISHFWAIILIIFQKTLHMNTRPLEKLVRTKNSFWPSSSLWPHSLRMSLYRTLTVDVSDSSIIHPIRVWERYNCPLFFLYRTLLTWSRISSLSPLILWEGQKLLMLHTYTHKRVTRQMALWVGGC